MGVIPYGWSKNESRTFGEMWGLVQQIHGGGHLISPEMLISIFWEETVFTNRWQMSDTAGQFGPAVGFGQLEMKWWGKVWDHYGVPMNPDLILANDATSVRASSLALRFLVDVERRSKQNALNVYAGVAARPVNAKAVAGWLQCEQALQAAAPFTREGVQAALKKAKMIYDEKQSQHPDIKMFWDHVLRGIPSKALQAGMERAAGLPASHPGSGPK
ncbi:MAG: hypothetical protein IT186_21520 [Acidobacteria bacterium]|nr:hypothetical protein [Acidobacteriota bacterium]MCG3192796.1 hypothetical protein [Thermoanaerobaculia bacterium]MCK6681188.1 hypothetical protein [Thermoanaerobaculia bacterium]